jgi:HK97 family phage portal protein
MPRKPSSRHKSNNVSPQTEKSTLSQEFKEFARQANETIKQANDLARQANETSLSLVKAALDDAASQNNTKGISYVRTAAPAITTNPLATDMTGRSRRLTLSIPQTDFDYEKAIGNPIMNSAIAACLFWICRTFPEAPMQVLKRDEHRVWHPQDHHDLIKLIRKPNPYYNSVILWMGTLVSYTLTGNAYWLKVRNKTGRVVELYYLPHTCVEPLWNMDFNEYLSYYEFRPGNGKIYKLDIEDVVHFRFGMDPLNDRKGMSQLASVLREVFTDNEANNFSASLLRNMGVPGIIISPSSDDTVIEEDVAQSIKESFTKRFTRDGRGEPMVLSNGVKVNPVQLNPAQLDLKMLHRLPEERVSAVLGIPAIVAGLGAGLDRSTMSNFKEAREMAYESNIIPTQRIFTEVIFDQLLGEFEPNTEDFKVDFDLSDVRVLQDDETVKVQRVDIAVRGGWMKRSEARAALNLPVNPEDERYLAGGNGIFDEAGFPVAGIQGNENAQLGSVGLGVGVTSVTQGQGIDEGLPAARGPQNHSAISAAQNLHRNSGASSTLRGSGQAPGQQARGYHGRFLDMGRSINGNGNDTQRTQVNTATQATNGKSDGIENIEYREIGPETYFKGDFDSFSDYELKELSKVVNKEIVAAEKFFLNLSHKAGIDVREWNMLDRLNETLNYASKKMVEFTCQFLENIYAKEDDRQYHTEELEDWSARIQVWSKITHLVAIATAKKGFSNIDAESIQLAEKGIYQQFRNLRSLTHHITGPDFPLGYNLVKHISTYSNAAWGTYYAPVNQINSKTVGDPS